jgi:phenylalanyl-tRNA synthetase beta chain
VGHQSNEACGVGIPTYRVDLKREIDLIEEVARLYGVDRIPATPPRGAFGENAFDATHDELGEARHMFTGLGLYETQGQTLVSRKSAVLVAAEPALVALANPLSSDMDVLRPSLLPGMLDLLRHNFSHQNSLVPLFEVGRVFSRVEGQTREERRLALALAGQRGAPFWSGDDRDARFDIYDLKGLLEEFFEQFGVRGVSYARRGEATAFFVESATLSLGGKIPLGEMGLLSPLLARQYDLRGAVVLAELNLDQLLARRNAGRAFKPLPAFPAIRRDVAMIVPESTTHESVLLAVKQAKPPHLESLELFDVFRGKHIPEGQKSLAYAFTYRHAEHTLTDAEVNAAHEQVVAEFKKSLRAVVREGE